MGGYELPHAVLMMIPEAWEHQPSMPRAKRDFYRYHASLMEPWDGPASIAFTDGTVIGAVLDRNGLRPSRYWVTADDLVIMASEVGVIDVDPGQGRREGSPPARAACSSSTRPRVASSTTTRSRRRLADQAIPTASGWPPTRSSWTRCRRGLEPGTRTGRWSSASRSSATPPRSCRILLDPMARIGRRADRLDGHRHADRGALGSLPPAVRLLLAALRPGHQPAARRHPRGAGHRHRRHHRPRGQPAQPAAVVVPPDPHPPAGHRQRRAGPSWSTSTTTRACRDFHTGRHPVPVPGGRRGRRAAQRPRRRAPQGQRRHRRRSHHPRALRSRRPTPRWSPIPSLLFTAAVHHHLIREKTRTRVGLVVETGRPARSTTCASCWGTAPRRSTRTSPSRPSRTASPRASSTWHDPNEAVANYIKAA